MEAFRILVADDHEVVRKGVVALLQRGPEWQVCAEVGDGREAVEQTLRLRPDLVILDLAMPILNGLEAAREIKKGVPDTRILIVTLYESEQIVDEVLRAGAQGFLLKSDSARDLVNAVAAIRNGRTYFSARIGRLVLQGYLNHNPATAAVPARKRLTPREREIVQLLAEGKSTKEVAAALGISGKTAETHRANIMGKLELHSVTDLVTYAVKNNILYIESDPFERAPTSCADGAAHSAIPGVAAGAHRRETCSDLNRFVWSQPGRPPRPEMVKTCLQRQAARAAS